MSPFISAVLRSSVLALIVFFSLRYLGFSVSQSLVGSLLPLLLGILNVSAGSAFALSAGVFFVAVLSYLFPAQYASATSLMKSALAERQTTPVPTQSIEVRAED